MDCVLKMIDIRARLIRDLNQSDASKKLGVPRITLQY